MGRILIALGFELSDLGRQSGNGVHKLCGERLQLAQVELGRFGKRRVPPGSGGGVVMKKALPYCEQSRKAVNSYVEPNHPNLR